MRSVRAALAFAPAVLALAAVSTDERAEALAHTRVFINGVMAPVSFNDGDSFRVQGGEWLGRQARLEGFNTLESFGPVHQWGDFHPYEMYVLSKMATVFAKRGTWHCFTEGDVDGYGRLLLDCPDLAVAQISRGLAHAMDVDDTPARPEYLRAQAEAIGERRGMWAHGVPLFVLSSLHSNDESPERRSPTYNRLVSTADGHSEKWEHEDVYSECQWVCYQEAVADVERARAMARRLREDPETGPLLAELSNVLLVEIVTRWVRRGDLPEWVRDGRARAEADHLPQLDPRLRDMLQRRLAAALRDGELGEREVRQGACHLYVAFERRYGSNRAGCVRGHGTPPPGRQQ